MNQFEFKVQEFNQFECLKIPIDDVTFLSLDPTLSEIVAISNKKGSIKDYFTISFKDVHEVDFQNLSPFTF